jgi:hypothetical protein
MHLMMACVSHTPLLYLAALRQQVEAFDPQLIVLFDCDRYGGQQMFSMPAFCIGVEAVPLADVGGTAGELNVPRATAIAAVEALRKDNVDAAVSYDMSIDHGFSQILVEVAGGIVTAAGTQEMLAVATWKAMCASTRGDANSRPSHSNKVCLSHRTVPNGRRCSALAEVSYGSMLPCEGRIRVRLSV